MARPASLVDDCRMIHAGLLERGVPAGQAIRRDQWAQLVALLTKCSASQERNITQTGKLNMLWDVVPGRGPGNHGAVTLRPAAAGAKAGREEGQPPAQREAFERHRATAVFTTEAVPDDDACPTCGKYHHDGGRCKAGALPA